MDTSITKVCTPSEQEKATMQIAEIRFDCLVRMYDYTPKKGKTSSDIPQWFKSETRISMETLEYMSEHELGLIIKQAYFLLKASIEQYADKYDRPGS